MTACQRLRTRLIVCMALCVAFATADAREPVRYSIDPVHTRVVFEIDHAGFSKAIGTISGSEGTLQFDADDWSTARLEVTVPMHRLDMGDHAWAAAVFAPRFLDVKRYPQAHFVSSRVTQDDARHGTACGELTLHGVTRPLCMALVLNRIARQPLPPFRRTAGFSATASLSRSDFGMKSWGTLVGNNIDLRIEAELVRGGGDPDNPVPESEPAGD